MIDVFKFSIILFRTQPDDWIEIVKILAPLLGVLLICLFQAHTMNSPVCKFLEKLGFKLEEKTKKEIKWLMFHMIVSIVLFIKLIYLVFFRFQF